MSLHDRIHRILKNQFVSAQITHSASCLAYNKLSTNDSCYLRDGGGGGICSYIVFLEIKKAQRRQVPEAIQII